MTSIMKVRSKLKEAKVLPPSSPGDEFELTAEMMVNDFDDERTLDEEEALEALEEAEEQEMELSNLEKDLILDKKVKGHDLSNEIEAVKEESNVESQSQIPEEVDKTIENKAKESSVEPELVNTSSIHKNNNEEVEKAIAAEEEDKEVQSPSLLHELYKDDPMTGTLGARQLRSGSRQQSEEEEEEDEDGDYSPEEEDWKKTIMVGSDYQAVIPDSLYKYDDAMPYENEDKLLWDPTTLSNDEVHDFLASIQSAQMGIDEGVNKIPNGSHVRDDEQALYLLLQCGQNIEEAIRRRTINTISPSISMSLWSEEECRNFESGLRQYGKDFHIIQQNRVRTRSVSELVQFYYLWKKTERHDLFAVKARLEKKKYNLHPGTTDFMERFLDEQESVSSSPNVHSLLSGDPKRQAKTPPPQLMSTEQSDLVAPQEFNITNHIVQDIPNVGLNSVVRLATMTKSMPSTSTERSLPILSSAAINQTTTS